MRSIRRAAHRLAVGFLGLVSGVLLALEAIYLSWLPRERPVRATRPLPPFVRAAIWAELGGGGQPRLDPQIPFLISVLLSTANPQVVRDHTLLHLVSRNALPRMKQLEFTARSMALATWVSRHWTIEEVIDSVGSQAWMGAAGYGFEAGAQHYWGRPLDALAAHEVATLMTVMRSPRSLDPACWPERALDGRASALVKMRRASVIDEDAFRQAMAAPMRVLPTCDRPPEARSGRVPPREDPCHRGGLLPTEEFASKNLK